MSRTSPRLPDRSSGSKYTTEGLKFILYGLVVVVVVVAAVVVVVVVLYRKVRCEQTNPPPTIDFNHQIKPFFSTIKEKIVSRVFSSENRS